MALVVIQQIPLRPMEAQAGLKLEAVQEVVHMQDCLAV